MSRLTKATIVRTLKTGGGIPYKAAANKPTNLSFPAVESRRLFTFLLNSSVREAKNLPEAFIAGIWEAYDGDTDADVAVATAAGESATPIDNPQTWRIRHLTTKNFGGINLSDDIEFQWNLEGNSWLIDGENGSGKTSLLGAIVWALSGSRPRDEGLTDTHHESDVMDNNNAKVGSWPPLAAYPRRIADLFGRRANVEVRLILVNDSGETAEVYRCLKDGILYTRSSANFQVDDVFISTGITMPTILTSLRLKDGENALTQAVAQLTGLDELVQVGELADGLCHAAREYMSFAKKSNMSSKLLDFQTNLVRAKEELAFVKKELPDYQTKDANEINGSMTQFTIGLSEFSKSLADALSKDLIAGFDARQPENQRAIIVALERAKEALSNGLVSIELWASFQRASEKLTSAVEMEIRDNINKATIEVQEIFEAERKESNDNRFRLKANAAAWHMQHHGLSGSEGIDQCPLCQQALAANSPLRKELEQLRGVKKTAQLALDQSLIQTQSRLIKSVDPVILELINRENIEPGEALRQSIRKTIGRDAAPTRILKTFTDSVEQWLENIPNAQLQPGPIRICGEGESAEHFALLGTMNSVERVLSLIGWFRESEEAWLDWWNRMVSHEKNSEEKRSSGIQESTLTCVNRLINAMDGAKPYSRSVDHLHSAIRAGREYEELNAEQRKREKVAVALAPLKQLSALAQSVARDAIEGLSGRIKTILDGMHIAERFQYETATLHKREGLIVRGSFKGDLRIDVSAIANTSWLRSTLWAFVFALRQEAVEQHGNDPFPVWLFDDPQLTFDLSHRLNWSSYVSGLKNGTSAAQVVITTHDEGFAARLRNSEFKANEATLKGASSDSGQMLILEGSRAARYWEIAANDKASTEKATQYIGEARIYFEGMLKGMLAGQGADVIGDAPSALVQRIDSLIRLGQAPWDRACFKSLVATASQPAIKSHLNEAHHTTRSYLTYAEASAVNSIWPKLSNLLAQCFREIRDYRLLHGMPSAFQLTPSTLEFPDGLAHVVKQQQFKILGRASAFSGLISEGALNYENIDTDSFRQVRLGQHDGYRLCANTLEPVARPGNILLVHQVAKPFSPSLVVAIAEEKFVARRFVLSDASSDVAVLTANALDPYEIAAPIVARKESLKLRSIVGVLFCKNNIAPSEHEIQPCLEESELKRIFSQCAGLVLVAGQSAQPLALDGQYLLVGERVKNRSELTRLNGLPVIALDSEQHHYFKRLRLMGNDVIVLESLDGGGDYPPELLYLSETGKRRLEECREVLGVLFELPG